MALQGCTRHGDSWCWPDYEGCTERAEGAFDFDMRTEGVYKRKELAGTEFLNIREAESDPWRFVGSSIHRTNPELLYFDGRHVVPFVFGMGLKDGNGFWEYLSIK